MDKEAPKEKKLTAQELTEYMTKLGASRWRTIEELGGLKGN